MDDYKDMEILEALIELKNQIQNLRSILVNSTNDASTPEETSVSDHVSNIDDYRTELTTQEINALLFTPPAEKAPSLGPVAGQDTRDETIRLNKELLKFREQTEKEINDLKNSVSALSEMFGRHELEIQKRNFNLKLLRQPGNP